MQKLFAQIIFAFLSFTLSSQTFVRSELSTQLTSPWEIVYGPDNFLWLTEAGGKVSRVDPATGTKTNVYTAADYFGGAASEKSPLCFQPNIGAGTLGMALHPDFISKPFIYFVHSYNSGTDNAPVTKFKIRRLTWNHSGAIISADTTLVELMPTGYDHLGGRLMIIEQNSIPYLFFTVGDNGVSETNEPACYTPQSNNPNNKAQDPGFKNGKIHRFNLNGSIPSNNPLPGNSFYTRGHRNPQGLMYNPVNKIIYDIEHGDRTDDEINILEPGKNYGWKNVRGFHNDNNFTGESAYINGYIPDPTIINDGLREPMLTWCSTPQPTNGAFLDWCTVAPSDGVYYGSTGIAEWTNSLLVVTLKNGLSTDQELYQFKLDASGTGIVPSTPTDPNPKKFFGADQNLNGRLRDLTIAPDGKTIYLINNGGNVSDRITVYTYAGPSGLNMNSSAEFNLSVYPNPANEFVTITCTEELVKMDLCNVLGKTIFSSEEKLSTVDVTNLTAGTYYLKMETVSGKKVYKKLLVKLH